MTKRTQTDEVTPGRLRGVNLGGWLVLEKWLTPSLFAGIKGPDEYSLCSKLGSRAAATLKIHRDTFITEADFKWIARSGLNAVRLPVGYWIFGKVKPYVGGIGYVDRAMEWAETYGLKVILDLHGAPGSQNGEHHSGRAGKVRWHKDDNIEQTLAVLERLCRRYRGVPALAGIEVLNEPSWKLGKRTLVRFYEQAYGVLRKHLGDEVAVIVPDAFRPKRWKRVLRGKKYTNVVLDAHFYQLYGSRGQHRTVAKQIALALRRRRLIQRLQRTRPLMIGEWSAALAEEGTLQGLSEPQRHQAYRDYAAAQLVAYAGARSWFYWTYKTENGGPWSLRDCVRRGWLPKRFDG